MAINLNAAIKGIRAQPYKVSSYVSHQLQEAKSASFDIRSRVATKAKLSWVGTHFSCKPILGLHAWSRFQDRELRRTLAGLTPEQKGAPFFYTLNLVPEGSSGSSLEKRLREAGRPTKIVLRIAQAQPEIIEQKIYTLTLRYIARLAVRGPLEEGKVYQATGFRFGLTKGFIWFELEGSPLPAFNCPQPAIHFADPKVDPLSGLTTEEYNREKVAFWVEDPEVVLIGTKSGHRGQVPREIIYPSADKHKLSRPDLFKLARIFNNFPKDKEQTGSRIAWAGNRLAVQGINYDPNFRTVFFRLAHLLATADVDVMNIFGLHARPSTGIFKTAKGFGSEIKLEVLSRPPQPAEEGKAPSNKADAKNILTVLGLAAPYGAKIRISARGHDAEKAVAELEKLFGLAFATVEGYDPAGNPLKWVGTDYLQQFSDNLVRYGFVPPEMEETFEPNRIVKVPGSNNIKGIIYSPRILTLMHWGDAPYFSYWIFPPQDTKEAKKMKVFKEIQRFLQVHAQVLGKTEEAEQKGDIQPTLARLFEDYFKGRVCGLIEQTGANAEDCLATLVRQTYDNYKDSKDIFERNLALSLSSIVGEIISRLTNQRRLIPPELYGVSLEAAEAMFREELFTFEVRVHDYRREVINKIDCPEEVKNLFDEICERTALGIREINEPAWRVFGHFVFQGLGRCSDKNRSFLSLVTLGFRERLKPEARLESKESLGMEVQRFREDWRIIRDDIFGSEDEKLKKTAVSINKSVMRRMPQERTNYERIFLGEMISRPEEFIKTGYFEYFLPIFSHLRKMGTPEEGILIAQELNQALAGLIEAQNVRACLLKNDTAVSHGVIALTGIGIPVAFPVPEEVYRGHRNIREMILDTNRGDLIINPSPEVVRDAKVQAARLKEREAEQYPKGGGIARTEDGYPIAVYGNGEILFPRTTRQKIIDHGGQGMGVVRVGDIYRRVKRRAEVTVDRLVQNLVRLSSTKKLKKVFIRFLDRRQGEVFPWQEGESQEIEKSGLRFLLYTKTGREIFKDMAKALMIAQRKSRGKNLVALFSMVSTSEEVDDIFKLWEEAKGELTKEGIKIAEVPLSFVLETPSSIDNLKELAGKTDDLVLGTNDLIALLKDRSRLYDARDLTELDFSLIRLMNKICRIVSGAAKEQDRRKTLVFPGELTNNDEFLTLLLGLQSRYPNLEIIPSRAPVLIPRAKEFIRRTSLKEAGKSLKAALKERRPEPIKDYTKRVLTKIDELYYKRISSEKPNDLKSKE